GVWIRGQDRRAPGGRDLHHRPAGSPGNPVPGPPHVAAAGLARDQLIALRAPGPGAAAPAAPAVAAARGARPTSPPPPRRGAAPAGPAGRPRTPLGSRRARGGCRPPPPRNWPAPGSRSAAGPAWGRRPTPREEPAGR